MKYLLLGRMNAPTSALDSLGCFEIISAVMYEELEKLGHEVYPMQAPYDPSGGDQSKYFNDHFAFHNIPQIDAILYIGYDHPLPFHQIRQISGAKVMVSLLEVPVGKMDWYFYFVSFGGKRPNSTRIFAPAAKSVYYDHRMPFSRKEIIMDHHELVPCYRWDGREGETDWAVRISDWLEEVKDDYVIQRIVTYSSPDDGIPIKPHELVLRPTTWGRFLDLTDTAETYVVTHTEGYGYNIIDMVCRGIRVIAPPHFLNPEFVEKFHIPVFNNKEEMLALIRQPLQAHWSSCIEECTDYSEVAKMVGEKIKQLRYGK